MTSVYNKEFKYELDGRSIMPKILKSDCDDEMIEFGFTKAFEALEKYTIEKEIANYIKREFDNKYDKTWHCIVGNDYSVSLTHDSRNFLFFSIETNYFLIFKL